MNQDFKYSIGHDIVSKYEAELLASLPNLYPNEGERAIVEQVIIPQFRTKLQETFDGFMTAHKYEENQAIKSNDIPELCKDIDQMLLQNRELLDIKGVFAPAYKIIADHRKHIAEELESAQVQQFRDILASHGVTDRKSLLDKGVVWFIKSNFPPYGKGVSFAGTILGKRFRHIESAIFEEIADALGFSNFDPKLEKQNQLQVLAAHGITDRKSLLDKGSMWFRKTDFPPYGKGEAFAVTVLGHSIEQITSETLEIMADRLGFPKASSEQERQYKLQALAAHGITDRKSLLDKGVVWFRKTDFPPYGKGVAFAGTILAGTGNKITSEILEEIAGTLGLPEVNESSRHTEKQNHLQALFSHGIIDRKSLLDKGGHWFRKTDFPPYGKGIAFAVAILGYPIKFITSETLEEIAGTLGLPEIAESTRHTEKQSQLQILVAHGITSRQALVHKGPKWFMNADCPPYGKGIGFAGAILGHPVKFITSETLEEIAGILFGKFDETQERQEQVRALASHNITDRKSLLAKSVRWFIKTDFPPYGKGRNFAGLILGYSVGDVSTEILKEIADALFPDNQS